MRTGYKKKLTHLVFSEVKGTHGENEMGTLIGLGLLFQQTVLKNDPCYSGDELIIWKIKPNFIRSSHACI